jgi:zinc transport system substrate-binding protein
MISSFTSKFSLFAALLFTTTAAQAEVPNVVTDIPPVHGLVSAVMDGVGAPELLITKGASPHGFALRPSQVRALSKSDVIFWTNDKLAPWLADVRETLAPAAISVALVDLPQSLRLPYREGAVFGDAEAHDEHDEHHEEGEHHDEHDEHHEEGEHHDEHDEHHEEGEHHDGHAGHDHTGSDPHAWLDPENAIVWLDEIVKTLADLDPEHAEQYAANAEAAIEAVEVTSAHIQLELTPFQDLSFVVFHDAYQYFEGRFDLAATGAISLGDSAAPSPARIGELQDQLTEKGVECVFFEPQFNPSLVETVIEHVESRSNVKLVEIDPLGTLIPLGPQFYTDLLTSVSNSVSSCR